MNPIIDARIEKAVAEMRRMIREERAKRHDEPGSLEWLDKLDAELALFRPIRTHRE